MGDILKKASIDISTAFDANKAQKDTARLKSTVEKTAEEIKNDRLKELALLFKEGKIDAEQLAALKKRVDTSTFNNELAQEKRLHALKIKNTRDHAKLSERLGSAFNAVGSFAQNPGGAMGAAVSKIPGGVAVAAGFAALTAVTATLNKKIVDVSAGYEKQLNIIQSVTNASDEQRAAFTRVIGSLGASTQWSASDVARGYESLVRGGLTVDEANLTIRGAVDLATAQNVTIENAGELITTAAHQFGLDSSQSERISDVVTTALSGSAQNMADFSEALKYSGVQLNSIGASIEQTSAMIMQLADVGVKGSSAGNALKNLAQRLNANRDKLEALGVSVIDAQGAFLSLPEILADIKEKTSTMSDSERGAFFKSVFGANFTAPIQSLVEHAADIAGKVETLNNANGATARAVETMSRGVSALVSGIGSKIEALAIKIGDALKPLTEGFLQSFDDFVKGLSETITPFLEEIKRAFTNVFGSSSGASLSENIGRLTGYVVGEAAAIISNIVAFLSSLLRDTALVVDFLRMIVRKVSSGYELKYYKKQAAIDKKASNAAATEFIETRKRYYETAKGDDELAKGEAARGLLQSAVEGKRNEETAIKTARALRQALIDRYQKSNGEFDAEYYNESNTRLREALDRQEQTYLNNIEQYNKVLNDEAIKAAASARPSDFVGATDDETADATAEAADAIEYTADELKRINKALRDQVVRRLENIDELSAADRDELIDALDNAETQDEFAKALKRAENRAYSYEVGKEQRNTTTPAQIEANHEQKALEDTARAFGLDFSYDELIAFRKAVDNIKNGGIGNVLAAAKLDVQTGKTAAAVSSAFGEVNYNADYQNRVTSRLEKLLNVTDAIKRNTEQEQHEKIGIEAFNL